MEIVYKPIHEIIPYPNNPRNNKKAIDAVASSIKEFGFRVPLVLDANNVVTCGHTRLEAARRLGLQEVPCIIADDLDEEQIKAFRLADNQVAEFSTWDEVKLEMELNELGIDLSDYGFMLGKVLKDTSEEIDIGDFDDEEFDTECPECGFRFNR